MHLWGLLALTGAIWSARTEASSASSSGSAEQHYGKVVNQDDPDPLWDKYGLNKSEEFKYFHEPGHDDILGHYDSRYFTEPVADEERPQTMTYMVRAYLNFFEENGLETWIAHGTLLGWWWNGKVSLLLPVHFGMSLTGCACLFLGHALGLGYGYSSTRYYLASACRPL